MLLALFAYMLTLSDSYVADNILIERTAERLFIQGGSVKIDYDLRSGFADVFRVGENYPAIKGFFAETEIDGNILNSTKLRRNGEFLYINKIEDNFGKGVKVSVNNEGDDYTIQQNFYVYQTRDYILFEVVVESRTGVLTNYIAPIVAATSETGGVLNIGDVEDPRFLFVPFDNDDFIRYRSDRLLEAIESYEVTSVFDNVSRRGFVTGSVSHEAWKTGVRVKTSDNSLAIADFRVFGGISTSLTRDTEPHGAMFGNTVNSPKIFFGFYDDWRDGMEDYGNANSIVAPPLPWNHGAPFGWNSWSAVAEKVDYEVYVKASDFLKNEMPSFANHKGIVYINFDSFWDNLPEQQRIDAATHVKTNGQHPGIYYTPFTFWGNLEQSKEWRPRELGRSHTWHELLLKDKNGNPVSVYAGKMGFALDPTHPGTIEIARVRLNQFRNWGYEFVKFDFLSHGSVEGEHFNKDIRTGKQAYNYGMDKILEILGDDIPEQRFFISLSIAPIFPGRHAHARRISCDVFGDISNAEYMLNSLSYGWWLNRTVYPYNDPDHIAVYNTYVQREPMLFNEGLTRYISSAIVGGLMLTGDDFRIPEARERTVQIFSNNDVNKLAAEGISFRPVEGNTGDRAADIFVRHDSDDDVMYVAVFNFSKESSKTMTLNLERLGIDPTKTWRVRNLISQQEAPPVSSGYMTITLAEAEPGLFKFFR